WQKSTVFGSVMLRPVFGEQLLYSSASNNVSEAIIKHRIWPNPATTELNVEVENETNQKIVVRMTNCFGQVVLEKNSLAGFETLDLQSINNGIYFVTIQIGDAFINKSIVINK
ncbi:MAG: T9SS type A sorting domain-containing protein, partial [Bacteroidetes bacterium]|nr:T9SS type A sorting domain-containing protein [Bacteroidota bacterium]